MNSISMLGLGLTLGGAAVGIWGCGESQNFDGSFQLWCGDVPCAWTVEQGAIDKVGTWHAEDFGVALLEPDTVLSQRLDSLTSCIELRVLADTAARSDLFIEVDLGDDGTVETSYAVPAARYEPVTFYSAVPGFQEMARIVVRREGSAPSTVAQVKAVRLDTCPVGLTEAQRSVQGGPCAQDDDCRDQVSCLSEICGCSEGGDCR